MKPKSRTNETHKAWTLALALGVCAPAPELELWALHPRLLLVDGLRDTRHVGSKNQSSAARW
jgi:hypothetical protein